jgi:hypothetical protein
MKMNYKLNRGKAYLYLKYDTGEWERIKKKYTELGLETRETTNGFGRGVSLEFYKDTQGLVDAYIREKVGEYAPSGGQVINDVNAPVLASQSYYNLAPLRVVPGNNGEVELPMTSLASANEINTYADLIVKAVTALLNVSKAASVNISFEEK